MSNFTDFFPAAGGGGGGIPKYAEFTASGTFTPSQDLIDAGGRIAYMIIGGGERGTGDAGGAGGAVLFGYETLTSTTGCAVTIGAGGTCDNCDGGDTTVAFASAGGTSVTAGGGQGVYYGYNGGGWGHITADGGTAYSGAMGYGRGGAGGSNLGGNYNNDGLEGKYGSGSSSAANACDGFVRITWFE